MRAVRHPIAAFIAVILITILAIDIAQSSDYVIRDIRSASECSYLIEGASDINEASLVSTNCWDGWTDVGYLYNCQNDTLEKAIDSSVYSYSVLALNDSAHYIGKRSSVLTDPISFLYDGSMHYKWDLGVSTINALNNFDEVTGVMQTYDSFGNTVLHAYVYEDGVVKDIGTLGGSNSSGSAINDHGQITGSSQIEHNSEISHAFLYDPSTQFMQDIGTLGGPHSKGESINENGQITGYSDMPDGSRHAFIYSDGMMNDIGTLGGQDSYGVDINNHGYVVGNSQNTNGETVAFLYDGENILDLCQLANCSASGWRTLTAKAISDEGNIVGLGFTNEGDRASFVIFADGQVPPPPSENCNDGIDNDGDGLTDCQDTQDCSSAPNCGAPPEPEICNDGIDNDGDGLIDCFDKVDCRQDPACKKGGGGTGGGGSGSGGGGSGSGGGGGKNN